MVSQNSFWYTKARIARRFQQNCLTLRRERFSFWNIVPFDDGFRNGQTDSLLLSPVFVLTKTIPQILWEEDFDVWLACILQHRKLRTLDLTKMSARACGLGIMLNSQGGKVVNFQKNCPNVNKHLSTVFFLMLLFKTCSGSRMLLHSHFLYVNLNKMYFILFHHC